jgi:hypothetical protein
MAFIERELFHDKRRNLTVYEMRSFYFIGTKSWWHLLNRSSSTIKKKHDCVWKAPNQFYCHKVLMAFIEVDLFHDNRRNLILYEKFLVNFIDMKSWWHLLKWISSTIIEGTRSFMKSSCSILLAWSPDDIYWKGLFHNKTGNLTFYLWIPIHLISTKSRCQFWRVALPR